MEKWDIVRLFGTCVVLFSFEMTFLVPMIYNIIHTYCNYNEEAEWILTDTSIIEACGTFLLVAGALMCAIANIFCKIYKENDSSYIKKELLNKYKKCAF